MKGIDVIVGGHDHGVKPQGIHQLDRPPLGHVGPIVPLDHVSGSQKQGGLLIAHLIRPGGEVRYAAQELMRAQRSVRFGETVKIIHLKNP